MIIKMRDFGTSLCTRMSGRQAYEAIMSTTNSLSSTTVFDFEGVCLVTNSFADEVFGRLAFELGFDTLKAKTTFINVDGFTAKIIRESIDFRSGTREKGFVSA